MHTIEEEALTLGCIPFHAVLAGQGAKVRSKDGLVLAIL